MPLPTKVAVTLTAAGREVLERFARTAAMTTHARILINADVSFALVIGSADSRQIVGAEHRVREVLALDSAYKTLARLENARPAHNRYIRQNDCRAIHAYRHSRLGLDRGRQG